MSTRRKTQAPNRQRAGIIHVLFLGVPGGALTDIGGAYTSMPKLENALGRIQFPHHYGIVDLPLDRDMFSTLGEMNMRLVDELDAAPADLAPADPDGPWQVADRNPVRRFLRQRRENRAHARERRNAQVPAL